MDSNAKRPGIAALALAAACTLAACGGGGGTTAMLPAASAPAAQQPAASAGFRLTQTAVAGPAAPANLPPLQSGGYGVALSVPAADPGSGEVTLTEAFTDAAPAGAPSLQSALRSARGTSTATSPFMLSYVEIVAGGTISFKKSPSFSFVVPSAVLLPGYAYYIALLDPQQNAWTLAFAGPATISGNTLTFAPSNSTLKLDGNRKYVFAVYGVPAPATPTPAPTPASPLTLTPATAALVLGPGSSQTSAVVTASQPGNAGALQASLSCAVAHGAPGNSTVATVSPATAAPAAAGGPVTFTVSAQTGGTCTLTVTGSGGASATSSISVFQAFATIQ